MCLHTVLGLQSIILNKMNQTKPVNYAGNAFHIKVLNAALTHKSRNAYAGGSRLLRKWFCHQGSMTRYLRQTGTLAIHVDWYQLRLPIVMMPSYSKNIWLRHTLLQTPSVCIEAWVWIDNKYRFCEKSWFGSKTVPVGDVLFQRRQRRQFHFFSLPSDTRIFRYSQLKSPQGHPVHLVEATEM